MTETKTTFELSYAQGVADRIVDELSKADAIERALVVGSIRRRVPHVHDVDIVVIPTFDAGGLFGDIRVSRIDPWVRKFEAESRVTDVSIGPKKVRFVSKKTGVPIELYIADERTWWTLVVIRTGSANHNIHLAISARERGMVLHADGRGIEDFESQRHVPDSEERVFELCGVSWKEPQERR